MEELNKEEMMGTEGGYGACNYKISATEISKHTSRPGEIIFFVGTFVDMYSIEIDRYKNSRRFEISAKMGAVNGNHQTILSGGGVLARLTKRNNILTITRYKKGSYEGEMFIAVHLKWKTIVDEREHSKWFYIDQS